MKAILIVAGLGLAAVAALAAEMGQWRERLILGMGFLCAKSVRIALDSMANVRIV